MWILGAARLVVSTGVGSHNVFFKLSFLLLKCFEMRGLFVFLCNSVYNDNDDGNDDDDDDDDNFFIIIIII